jgi:hypothetical protein
MAVCPILEEGTGARPLHQQHRCLSRYPEVTAQRNGVPRPGDTVTRRRPVVQHGLWRRRPGRHMGQDPADALDLDLKLVALEETRFSSQPLDFVVKFSLAP